MGSKSLQEEKDKMGGLSLETKLKIHFREQRGTFSGDSHKMFSGFRSL